MSDLCRVYADVECRCRRPVHSCCCISTRNNFRSLCLENHKHIFCSLLCLAFRFCFFFSFFSVAFACDVLHSVRSQRNRHAFSRSFVVSLFFFSFCWLPVQLLLWLKSTGAFDVNRKTNILLTVAGTFAIGFARLV